MTNDIEVTQRHADWTVVGRGWGHAVENFATLSEPANVREYVSMHDPGGVYKPFTSESDPSLAARESPMHRGVSCWSKVIR